MDYTTYSEIVKNNAPKKHMVRNGFLAFVSGGLMGILAQSLIDLGINVLQLEKNEAMSFSAIVIVFLAAVLTMVGWYNNMAQIVGAGLFIPTTGFANSMTSAAIEGKFEGPIFGVGTRMFALAGSVITYGIFSAVILCVIRYLLTFVGVPL